MALFIFAEPPVLVRLKFIEPVVVFVMVIRLLFPAEAEFVKSIC